MAKPAERHVPLRRCAVCRDTRPQAELIRLVQDEGAYRLDLARRLGGRGTWVCRACAAEPNEKKLRQAFRGQAQQVRALLVDALAVRPDPATQRAAGAGTEGMHDR